MLDLSRESSATRIALRPGRPGHRRFRPQLPDRPAAAGAAACGSCKSGAVPTTASRAATGTRTKTSPAITATMGTSMDKPAAALIKDLKSRGLLDDTIVIWTTEFGRMPCSQGSKGRDHNPVHLHLLAGRRRNQGGRYLRRQRRMVVQGRRKHHLLLRLARDRAASSGNRPHPADLPAQRHRPPADRRPRAGDQGDPGVSLPRPVRRASIRRLTPALFMQLGVGPRRIVGRQWRVRLTAIVDIVVAPIAVTLVDNRL